MALIDAARQEASAVVSAMPAEASLEVRRVSDDRPAA